MRQRTESNDLLDALLPEQRSNVAAACERVKLETGSTLIEAGEDARFVHFVESGFLSAIRVDEVGGVEIGLIGREGLSGSWVALGRRPSPFKIVVQSSGVALRMPIDDFADALANYRELRDAILSYCHSFTGMVAETCHSHTRLRVEQRLARWLLMAHDRLSGDELAITHEVLAKLLGVRRPGVTVAIHILEGEHMIKARRGTIRIVNPDKLAALARKVSPPTCVMPAAYAA